MSLTANNLTQNDAIDTPQNFNQSPVSRQNRQLAGLS